MDQNEDEDLVKFKKRLAFFVLIYVVCDLVFVVLFKTVFMLMFIRGDSMENALRDWDVLIGTRYDVTEDELERYDIVNFTVPDSPDETYIKRLIGLPGEKIEVKDGRVYADGAELDGSYIKEFQDDSGDGVYEVPEGCYFVLGDNRNDSSDSRFWDKAYVPLGNIHAKAKRIIFPFSHAGSLEYDE